MSADATDQRFFYSATLGRTQTQSIDGTTPAGLTGLEQGRYLISYLSLSAGSMWVLQGGPTVTATAAAPSTPLGADGIRAIEMNVRGTDDNALSALCDLGETATLVVTKISRGKS